MLLHGYLEQATRERPDHVALEEPGAGKLSYRDLARLAGRVRDHLARLGVGGGDRVGIHLRKSIDSVAAILGVLETGAAYVPLDPSAPASRNAYIVRDCTMSAVFTEQRLETALRAELGAEDPPPLLVLPGVGGGSGLQTWLEGQPAPSEHGTARAGVPGPDDLAYVLYTSGSTGRPKGVMLTHRNAVSFVEWCAEVFEPRASDRFSSHAPFHFDLSIFDLYLTQRAGGTVVLVGEERGKEPVGLARLIEEYGISVWYSAPSILTMLALRGRLETLDLRRLRMILFAGEVFPVRHLRNLAEQLPHPRYLNLYGPTETNVCTFYEVPLPVPEDRTEPYPIGRVCSHLEGLVVDEAGSPAPPGSEGELCIHGPSVMRGYWNLPDQTARAFLARGDKTWYRTGDVVVGDADGNYRFVGRRDRMVKRSGYRVELGEIEACLYRHPEVAEAAVVAHADESAGVRIEAHLVSRQGGRLSVIALKQFCAANLPIYMVPDAMRFHDALPKTSTDKVDYQTLSKMA